MPFVLFAALFIPIALSSIFKHEKMTERWLVKTACDVDASKLDCTRPIHSSIEYQDSLTPPRISGETGRLNEERTLYEFNAYLMGVKEETDGDYHLVLRSPYSKATLIAEIPNAYGSEAMVSPYAPEFAAARAVIDNFMGAPGDRMHWLQKPAHIHIQGIGFFDVKHSIPQEGAAPNARELHPVIKLELLN